ncbi:phosphoenolpyruvate-utilizing N-terminal domain-containing protein [Neptuniibacter sp. UBA6509]|uniref:phosphoenolpyruvate-utilizing N-terminal domain-containing protein n=1 Tax=Neptuniibacter sp. UBA6509 TaxID=1946976 RepID=UPI0032E48CA0
MRVNSLVKTQLKEEKEKVVRQSVDGEILGIFEIYQLLLEDSAFNHSLENELSSGMTRSAIKKTVMGIVETFEAMDDEYLASRAEDMLHLGNKVVRAIYELEGKKLHSITDKQIILFGNEVSVSDIALFGGDQILCPAF